MFQKNAWIDTATCLLWATTVWGRHTIASAEKLLFCDNLDAQVNLEFRELMARDYKTTVYYGPPNLTEDWQPIDAGYGCRVKEEYKKMQEDWLEKNQSRWENKKIPCKERRILVTKWVAAAIAKVNAFIYPGVEPKPYRWRLFEKTGCLLTANGELDDRIHPQSYPENYFACLRAPGPTVCKEAVALKQEGIHCKC